MDKKQSELVIITKAKDLADYVFTITHKSPKEYRFSVVARMQNYCLDAIEYLYRANDIPLKQASIKQREEYQREAMTALRLLGYTTDLGRKVGAIIPKQQEQIAKQLLECKRLLGAWVISDRKRLENTET